MSELAIFADSSTALTVRNDVIHRAVIQRVNLVLAQTKLPFSVWLRQMWFETHERTPA